MYDSIGYTSDLAGNTKNNKKYHLHTVRFVEPVVRGFHTKFVRRSSFLFFFHCFSNLVANIYHIPTGFHQTFVIVNYFNM